MVCNPTPTPKGFKTLSGFFILVILLTLINERVAAQSNYYFSSSSGDDSRSVQQAQNPLTPWKSIDKLNSFFEKVLPGDSILFKRGDTFYGALTVNKPGTKDHPIVISAYGKGVNPVLTGFSILSFRKSSGNNIYEAVVPGDKPKISCVVINNTLQPIGRFPKTTAEYGGYLYFEGHSGDDQITDNELKETPNWTGGEIVIRKNHWVLDKTPILSHNGNSLKFIPVTKFYPLVDESGYFIQNHPSTLTENGDWCYNSSDRKIKIFFSTVPPDAKVSTIDQLLTINADFIKISNISFEGANTKSIYAENCASLSIDHCSINFSGTFAAQMNRISGDFQFNDNQISNSLNNAVSVFNRSKLENSFCTIRNNTIVNTGIIAGMGESGDGKYKGLVVNSENGALIEYNTIKNTGYVPLEFNGNNILVKNNIIDNYLLVKQDGAGIYTWNGGNPLRIHSNLVIKGNIVCNGIGDPFGTIGGRTTRPSANGIYMDNNVNHIEILDNTVYNVSGKGNHNNSPCFITMAGNTFFNIGLCFDFVRYVNDGSSPANGGNDITNMNFHHNLFFTTSPENMACSYADRGVNFPDSSTILKRISAIGVVDHNYYHLPNELGFSYMYRNNKSSRFISSPQMTFENWRTFTGFDKNSKIIPVLPTYRINKLISSNLFSNGHFDTDINGVSNEKAAAGYTFGWDNTKRINGNGSLKISFVQPPSSTKDYAIFHVPIGEVNPAKNYIVRIKTTSTEDNSILRVRLKNSDSTDKYLTTAQSKAVGKSLINHEFLLKAPRADQKASLGIEVYQEKGAVCIDDVEVFEANVSPVDINDLARLEVNPTKEVRIVQLKDKYVDMEGHPYGNTITLQPFSSKILILQNSNH